MASAKHVNKGQRQKADSRTKPGPKPEVLKIEGDWEKAVKKSLAKKAARGLAEVADSG